jgi:acyl carrier protein
MEGRMKVPGAIEVVDVKKSIRKHIIESLLFGQEPESFGDDTSLVGDGIIDSTGVLELIEYIEATFGIEVLETETVPENLDSVSRASAFICRKLSVVT